MEREITLVGVVMASATVVTTMEEHTIGGECKQSGETPISYVMGSNYKGANTVDKVASNMLGPQLRGRSSHLRKAQGDLGQPDAKNPKAPAGKTAQYGKRKLSKENDKTKLQQKV